MLCFGVRDRGLPFFPAVGAKRCDVERARRDTVALFEAPREVGRRSEAAIERDLGEVTVAVVGENSQCAFEADALDELVERFPREGTEDAVKVERRKPRRLRDDLQRQRLIDVAENEIDRTVHALDVVE